MSGTPIPDKDNWISCCRVDGKLVSLAKNYRRKLMTFAELKKALETMNDEQLNQNMEVIIAPDDTILVELAVGVSSDALFFVPSFQWNKE